MIELTCLFRQSIRRSLRLQLLVTCILNATRENLLLFEAVLARSQPSLLLF
jgi:hypothetical protein